MNELISIIIPAYNIERFVSSCLDSVCQQSYTNLEIIVVDDGSTDRTAEILDSFSEKDRRIRVIHKENGGVTSARLRGISEASGPWIGFVDGDDSIEPAMFEHLLKNARENQADISHCGYQMVFPDRVDYYYNSGRFVLQENRDALVDLLSGAVEPGLWNKLFSRSLFQSSHVEEKIDKSIRIKEDLLMNFYLFREAKKIVFEDFCPYHYQVRENSAAKTWSKPYRITDPERVQRILMEETKGDPKLYSICMQKLASHLVRTSTMQTREKSTEIRECIHNARKALKELLPELKSNEMCSNKLIMRAQWAAISPESYRFIHRLYGEFSGANHRYDIK